MVVGEMCRLRNGRMGNAVLCLFPTSGLSSSSSTSTSSTSFPFPSFGFIPHRSRSHRKKSFALRPNQPKFTDLHQLRMKILQDISLTFPEPTIIILYAPPEFQIQEVGDFISQKVHLPLLDLDSLALRNVNESNNQDSENLECAFESRILDPDCLKGFVVLGYPETPKQLRSLRTNLPSFVTVPIFIDLDSEAMRRLRDRFDRWVHEPTDRSYHALSRPPLSLQGKPFVPTSKSMLDDHTGDPLVHRSCDDVSYYKTKFMQYHLKEALMRACFEEIYTIPSCRTKSELHGRISRVLALAVTHQRMICTTSSTRSVNTESPFFVVGLNSVEKIRKSRLLRASDKCPSFP